MCGQKCQRHIQTQPLATVNSTWRPGLTKQFITTSMVFNLFCPLTHTHEHAHTTPNTVNVEKETNHMKWINILHCRSLNRCCGHNFNVIDAFDTSVFGILWHRWRCSCIHWWCADTMIRLLLRLHRWSQAIGTNVIWSRMMWQCGGWSCRWKWWRNYWADRCIFTRLATVGWCWWCWCAHRFVAISTRRFWRCGCIESEYVLQWSLFAKWNEIVFYSFWELIGIEMKWTHH